MNPRLLLALVPLLLLGPSPSATDAWGRSSRQGEGSKEAPLSPPKETPEATAERMLPDPKLQEAAEELLAEYRVPYGAIVVLRVPDAKVLALAGHSTAEPALTDDDLTLHPWAPAASVFKLVTAAALLDGRNLPPATRVCYHGGMRALERSHLIDVPRLDRSCDTLGFAVAKSQNAIIAKLAHRYLDTAMLSRYALAFGFGESLPFARPVIPSIARLPAEPLEFARTAAGFWNTSLSPLHGALVANAIASGGWFRAPDGSPARRVMAPAAARTLAEMMTSTTRNGTARSAFRDGGGRPLLPFEVAGKTGSLTRPNPYLAYSWFVGFAPADAPRVAFAVLVGNGENWRVKAPTVARRLLEAESGRAILAQTRP